MRDSTRLLLSLPAVALAFAACASVPIPTKQLTDAKATIRAAAGLGATNDPAAQTALARARDEVDRGEDLIRDDEFEEATMVLERAVVDAELALALVRSNKAKVEASKAVGQLKSLNRTR